MKSLQHLQQQEKYGDTLIFSSLGQSDRLIFHGTGKILVQGPFHFSPHIPVPTQYRIWWCNWKCPAPPVSVGILAPLKSGLLQHSELYGRWHKLTQLCNSIPLNSAQLARYFGFQAVEKAATALQLFGNNIVGIAIFRWWVSYPPWLELVSSCCRLISFGKGGLLHVWYCMGPRCFQNKVALGAPRIFILWRTVFNLRRFVGSMAAFFWKRWSMVVLVACRMNVYVLWNIWLGRWNLNMFFGRPARGELLPEELSPGILRIHRVFRVFSWPRAFFSWPFRATGKHTT